VYEKELSFSDRRLGGLYNNMALALVDLNRFREAHELYRKAVNVMEKNPDGESEVAVTYLNMASALEAEKGLLDGDEEIRALLEKAMDCLEKHVLLL
jgi:tetratricopeptide (TPR) repeat protein